MAYFLCEVSKARVRVIGASTQRVYLFFYSEKVVYSFFFFLNHARNIKVEEMVPDLVPVPGRDDVYRLVRDTIAWNIDGSVDAKPRFGGSWIRFWEMKIGKNARRCSFVKCKAWAEDGGHVWIAGGNGAYIAPICKRCNCCENETRVQGSGSRLKHGTEVVLVDYTQSMRSADRRIAPRESEGEDYERECRSCGVDISNRPPNFTQCYTCWRGGRRGRGRRWKAVN